MAQDLLGDETYRHAVVMKPNGFLAVNYAKLGLKMTTLEEWKEAGLAAVIVRPSGIRVSSFSRFPLIGDTH